MKIDRQRFRFSLLLGIAVAVAGSPATGTGAAGESSPSLPEINPPVRAAVGESVEDHVKLEVREEDLILTNLSDRPINAWMIKTVVRSAQGYEAYAIAGTEAFRSSRDSVGSADLLMPGEAVTVPKGQKPWLREDHRGPGAGVYYEVGAITFEGGDAAGDPDVLDRLFASRLDAARAALHAIEATDAARAGDDAALDQLAEPYRSMLAESLPSSREETIERINEEARATYHAAVGNLRARELARLEPEPEGVR